MKLLLEANAFNFFNSNGHSTLWIARSRGHAEVVGLLLAASTGADIVDIAAHVTPLMQKKYLYSSRDGPKLMGKQILESRP